VADEVRKLAERTAGATSEIDTVIGSIQQKVELMSGAMKETSSKVEVGVKYASEAAATLGEIVASVDNLHLLVHQIATATEEMSATSEAIGRDAEGIAGASNETSASSEQTAQSAQQLAGLAGDLREAVGQFRV